MRTAILVALLGLFSEAAWAHGGTFADNPGSWRRGIPCTCAKPDCAKCSPKGLVEGAHLSSRIAKITKLERWGDIASLRVTVEFRTNSNLHFVEGYAQLSPAPVFAAVTADLRRGETGVSGRLRESEDARKRYLWVRRRKTIDPLLLVRRGPGRLDLRVCPIGKKEAAIAVIEGYALADAPKAQGMRVYRTGNRCIVVVPSDRFFGAPDFIDEKGGRALYLMMYAQVRERFPEAPVVEVPCVPALETAITGRGAAAASEEVVLAAFEGTAPLPPFVGEDIRLSNVPPGLRGSIDPEPPPPPPPPAKKGARAP